MGKKSRQKKNQMAALAATQQQDLGINNIAENNPGPSSKTVESLVAETETVAKNGEVRETSPVAVGAKGTITQMIRFIFCENYYRISTY